MCLPVLKDRDGGITPERGTQTHARQQSDNNKQGKREKWVCAPDDGVSLGCAHVEDLVSVLVHQLCGHGNDRIHNEVNGDLIANLYQPRRMSSVYGRSNCESCEETKTTEKTRLVKTRVGTLSESAFTSVRAPRPIGRYSAPAALTVSTQPGTGSYPHT